MLHQIGAGPLGQVFRAYDPEQDKLVAVKLFRLDLPPERVHQFVAELERLIAADLTHTSIAAPIAAGIVQASAYLAQDFVAADSLDTVVREHGPAPTAEGLRIVTQLAGALDYAAVVGVLHGALHPRDVLISPDDVRLTGLGIAKALELVGAPVPVRRPYAAPERGAAGPWDRRADVFSLAALAHELLWGRRITATGGEAAAGLTELQGARLDALRELFAAALAEEPAKRFPTALDFAEALKNSFKPAAAGAPMLPLEPELKRAATPSPDAITPAPAPVNPPAARELEIKRTDGGPAAAAPELAVAPIARLQEPPDLELRKPEAPAREMPVAEHVETLTAKAPDPPIQHAPEVTVANTPVVAVPAPAPAPPAPPAMPKAPDQPVLSIRPASDEKVEKPVPPPVYPVEVARSAVWPLALALIVGVALGFAGGYWLGEQRVRESIAAAAAPTTAETEVRLKSDPTSGARDGTPATVEPGAPASVAPPPAVPPAVEPMGSAPPPAAAPKPAAAPVARAGRITVRTTPAGARVLIDGRDVGKTPLTIPNLANGAHTVRVMRDGFTTIDRRVSLTTARPTSTLTLTLARSAPARGARAAAAPTSNSSGASSSTNAMLVVESRPTGATVFIDGKRMGTTPLAIPAVAAGAHAVRLEMAGYKPWTASVRVVAGEKNRVAASLEQ